jgi:hypothetical protein
VSDTLRLDNLAFGTRVMFRDGKEGLYVGEDTNDPEDNRYLVVQYYDDCSAELMHLHPDGRYYESGGPDSCDVVSLAAERVTVTTVLTDNGEVHSWRSDQSPPPFVGLIVDQKTVTLRAKEKSDD